MGFQTPITIEKALQHIAAHDYVLPAIQRRGHPDPVSPL